MRKYNRKLKKYKRYLKKQSKFKEKNTQNYQKRNNLTRFNYKTGEILQYTVEKELEKKRRDTQARAYYLQDYALKNDMVAIFLTLTLNPKFHNFNSNNNNNMQDLELDNNNNYINIDKNKYSENEIVKAKETFNLMIQEGGEFEEFGNLIKKGNKNLKRVFRNITKELAKNRSNRDKIPYKFLKATEPHKSLIPHLHGIIIVPRNMVKDTIRVIENKIKVTSKIIMSDTKTLYNSKKKQNGNNPIGRTELELIKETGATTKYLMKYLSKDLSSDDMHLLNGWYKVHKIKQITTSKIPLTKAIYSKLYYYIDNEIKQQLREKHINFLNYMVDNSRVVEYNKEYEDEDEDKDKGGLIREFEKEKVITHEANSNPIYEIRVYKEKYNRIVNIATDYEKTICFKRIVNMIILKNGVEVYNKQKAKAIAILKEKENAKLWELEQQLVS